MSTTITSVSMLPLGMLNAFIVRNDGCAIVVDTGLPGSAEKALAQLRRTPGLQVTAIVLTHGHIDHAGSATALRAILDVPVIAHELEVPYLSGARPILRPTRGFGHVFKQTGLIERPFDHVPPDIAVAGPEFDLSEFGFKGARLLHTPGHTPGSLSMLLPDGQTIAGDLAASGILLGGIALRSRPKQPPFEENSTLVAQSLASLLDRGGQTFYLGHGGPLPRAAIEAHMARLAAGA